RTVERVEDQKILAARILRRDCVGLVQFLRYDATELAAPFTGLDHDLVRGDVERLLLLGMDIDPRCRHRRGAERAARHCHGDEFTGTLHVVEDGSKVGVPLAVAAAMLDDELAERHATIGHRSPPLDYLMARTPGLPGYRRR